MNYIYKYGKRKGSTCNRNTNNDFCKMHAKCVSNKKDVSSKNEIIINKGILENGHVINNKNYCQATIPRGKRKGMHCLNKKKTGNYCGIHAKQFL